MRGNSQSMNKAPRRPRAEVGEVESMLAEEARLLSMPTKSDGDFDPLAPIKLNDTFDPLAPTKADGDFDPLAPLD